VATQPSQLRAPTLLQQGEKIIASDSGNLTVQFAPAGSILLFPKTTVEITQTLPVNLVFSQQNGVAEYRADGSSPISIRSYRLLTKVSQGTVRVTAEEETHTITIQVLEGSATVAYNDADIVSQVVPIEKGQQFMFDSDKRKRIK
jgi:hypothetical protein